MNNSLIAKAAIDRRLEEIITPVIEDLGFELVRVRLMSGHEIILQVMADRPEGGIEVDECGQISTAISGVMAMRITVIQFGSDASVNMDLALGLLLRCLAIVKPC